MTPWEIERLEAQERAARLWRQTRRLWRTALTVSVGLTVVLGVIMLVLDLKQEPSWQAATATFGISILGVSLGFTLEWAFDSWIESA